MVYRFQVALLIDAEGGDATDMALKEQFNEPWKTCFNGDEVLHLRRLKLKVSRSRHPSR